MYSAVAACPLSPVQVVVQTNGVNFDGSPQNIAFGSLILAAVWEYSNELDVNRIGCNDISQLLNFYGVEVARCWVCCSQQCIPRRAAIAREIRGVFSVYGISVDMRHLGLVADYMTQMASSSVNESI